MIKYYNVSKSLLQVKELSSIIILSDNTLVLIHQVCSAVFETCTFRKLYNVTSVESFWEEMFIEEHFGSRGIIGL